MRRALHRCVRLRSRSSVRRDRHGRKAVRIASLRRLGAARDALWMPETGDTRAETNRRAIWGAVNQPGEEAAAVRGSFPLLNRAFRIVERL